MKVYIGDIVSVNSSEEVFRYLVEDAGRICHVGDVLPEKYASAERVDLDGRALLLCAFIGWRQESDYFLERILGEERTEALNPIGSFERNGKTFHSVLMLFAPLLTRFCGYTRL